MPVRAFLDQGNGSSSSDSSRRGLSREPQRGIVRRNFLPMYGFQQEPPAAPFVPYEATITLLQEMGFESPHSEEAMRFTN